MTNPDLIAALAKANPIVEAEVRTLYEAPEREQTYLSVLARRDRFVPPVQSSRRRRLGIAAVVGTVVVALGLPVLGYSGRLGSLFGLSNTGTRVDSKTLDLRFATVLAQVGADQGVTLLDTRSGLSFYASRAASGALCLAVGPAASAERSFGALQCLSRDVAASFPSPAEPVADLSPLESSARSPSEAYVGRLLGFAADGVGAVEVVGDNGQVIAKAPVRNNVYGTGPLVRKTAAAIVAYDQDGKAIWREPLGG